MIPRRIKLSGFLCYKDEQEVAFEGSPLWMLAGLNGSGKSSIFDAVTYALFGHHRGGATNAIELINKDSKAMSVEFEFLVDNQPYRIMRTLRKDARGGVKGTQLISRLDPATGNPSPIPDTNLSDGFKNWIREKIGLTFDTFTSSVLLRQGRAEQLLDSTAKEKSQVLAGIVDLERYQKLHEKADTQRKLLKGKVEDTAAALTGVPEVSNFELLAADSKIIDAEQAREAAAGEVDRLQNLEFDAHKWAYLQTQREALDARWKLAESLIAESATIEAAYQRLRDLKEAIPHLLIIQEKQRAIEESKRTSQQLTQLKEGSEADRAQLESTLEVARKKKSSHQVSLMQQEQKLEAIRARLSELAGPLSQLGMFEEQTARLKRLDDDLKRLPKNLADDLRAAEKTFDYRVELGKVVPLLDRFASARMQLREASKRVAELEKAEAETRTTGEQTKQKHEEARQKLDQAVLARKNADEATTEARTVFQQAKGGAAEFEKMEGARVCRACGQKLTAAHWKVEKKKRDQELDEAVARHASAVAAQKAATSAETAARDQFAASERDLVQLRDAYRDTSKDLNRTREEVERLLEACRFEYQALSREYRERISPTPPVDWLTTTWPTADEQNALKKEAGELAAVRANVQQLQEQLSKQEKLQAERDATKQTLDSLQGVLSTADPATLRKEKRNLDAEETAFANQVRGTRKLIQENDLDIEKLNKQQADAQKALSNVESQLSVEAATRTQHQDAIDRASKLLSPAWREAAARAGFAEQNRWKTELEMLESKGTEAKYQELSKSRGSIEGLKQDRALVDADAAEIREEARKPVAEIKSLLTAARKAVDERNEEVQAAREAKAILDRQREDREKLGAQQLAHEKELVHYVKLSQLLGRDRLQRHLVRTAEKQIVDFANGILDRLSSGQLFLRLWGVEEGAGTERALELEAYNRVTGSTPINVAFLSGSQRFRVAVSLALGIGQYASRQHRPIESVIIDEGFGCLDRNGRQVMIQEMQNLKGQMKCILLVSHQEEFADAFADGYHFELVDGATKVTRVQK